MEQKRWDGSKKNDGINEITYCRLFRDFYVKDEALKQDYSIYKTITNFTIAPQMNLWFRWTKNGQKMGFNLIKKNNFNQYEYNDGKDIITFDIISNKIPDKELTSPYRYGKCHLRSLQLAIIIPNSKVITGYIINNQMKFLHSIVEVEKNDKTYILDWTRNVVLLKEDYLKLTGFQELSIINSQDIINDLDLLSYVNVSLKAYTLFRDEIMTSLEKNKDIFKNSLYKKRR